MSIPKLGSSAEVKGDFSCKINYQLNENKLRCYIKSEDFDIQNKAYRKLVDTGKVDLVWRVRCESTFIEKEAFLDEEIIFNTESLNTSLIFTYFLVASKEFTFVFDETISDFFGEKMIINKGMIVSTIKREILPIFQNDKKGGGLNIIEYQKRNQNEKIEFDFTNDKIIMYTNDDKVMQNLISFSKKCKKLNLSLIFGPALIQAIMILGTEEEEAQDLQWKTLLYDIIDIDDERRGDLSEFNVALSVYNKIFSKKEYVLIDSYDEINKLMTV